MKAALRDAKVAAAKARPGKRPEPKRTPWLGFFDLFRNLLGERAATPTRRGQTRLARQQKRRQEMERKAKQRAHEAWCDGRFAQNRQLAARAEQSKPYGTPRRLWKREWIEAEAYAENVRRARKKKAAA